MAYALGNPSHMTAVVAINAINQGTILEFPRHRPRAIAMNAAVNAKLSPNCCRLGNPAPTRAPPAVEAVQTLMITRPDPIKNDAPISFDFALSDIVSAQFSSPVICIVSNFSPIDIPANTSDNEAMIPIYRRLRAAPASAAPNMADEFENCSTATIWDDPA